MKICYECDKEFEKNEGEEINGNWICQDCIDEYYGYCEHCNTTVHQDDLAPAHRDANTRNNIIWVCCDCLEDYFTECRDCGEVYPNNCMVDDNLCDHCYSDNYTTCEHCDTVIHMDDSYYCEDCGYNYCEYCYNEHHRHDEDCSIHKYEYKPSPEFFNCNEKKPRSYVGIELEVENKGDQDNDSFVSDNLDYNEIYCKHDGSLDTGFEIVSHPMTLGYHKQFSWEKILNNLQKEGYRSHNTSTCGLHLHYSKKALTACDQIKLGIFINTQLRKMEIIGRRAQSDYAKFKDINNKGKKYANNNDHSRYEALNWNNYNTVEFRFPKGTLNYNTFISTIEFVFAVTSFVKTISTPQVCDLDKSWDMFTDYVLSNKTDYAELAVYLKSKNLVKEIEGEILVA